MIRTASPSLRIAAPAGLIVPSALRARLLGGPSVSVMGTSLASRPAPPPETPTTSALSAELDALDTE